MKFAAALGDRETRPSSSVVILFDAHELVEQLVDAESETAELRVIELEALVGLPVEDGEKPLLELVDRPRDVVAEKPPADDDENEADGQRPERRHEHETCRVRDEGPGRCGHDERTLAVFERRQRRARDEQVAVANDVGLLMGQRVTERVLGRLVDAVVEPRGRLRRVCHDLEAVALGRHEDERSTRSRFADARERVVERPADDQRTDDGPLVVADGDVRREVPVLLVPDVGPGVPRGQRRLEPRVDAGQIVAAAEVRVVATHHAATGIDQRDERRNIALEERRVLRAADEIVADLGRRIAAGVGGRLREGVGGRGLVRHRSEPALGSEPVELDPPRRTVDVTLRARRELVLVARRGSYRRAHEQERQQADHGHDQSVDRDDLDSHWPSDPPSYRR